MVAIHAVYNLAHERILTLDYIAALHRSITKLVRRFQCNPFDFLYERDLQATLFALLVEEFGDEKITMQGGFWKAVEYGESSTIRTIPVRCEYPSSTRFDISIIDPETVRAYDKARWQTEGLKNDAFWNQPVLAAVELKYCQIGDRPGLRKAECTVDTEKLRRYLEERGERTFCGISVLFIQSVSVAPEFLEGTKLDEPPQSGLARYVISRHDWWRFSV